MDTVVQRGGRGRRDRAWSWPRGAPTSTRRPTPSSADYPARPEWYFLSLFQMLKLFPGNREVIGTIVDPDGDPGRHAAACRFLDRALPRQGRPFPGLRLRLRGRGRRGLPDGSGHSGRRQQRRVSAGAQARPIGPRQRALYLAESPGAGIPPDGSAYILRRDPLTQGRGVLEQQCLGCHVFEAKERRRQTASDLSRFGSRNWIRGLLESPGAAAYFGKVAAFDGMARMEEELEAQPQTARRRGRFRRVVRRDPSPTPLPTTGSTAQASPTIRASHLSRKNADSATPSMASPTEATREAPKLFAWGSPHWIARMIRNPRSSDKYGFLDPKQEGQMPAFGPDQITASDLEALVRYLKDDYLKPDAMGRPRSRSRPTAGRSCFAS